MFKSPAMIRNQNGFIKWKVSLWTHVAAVTMWLAFTIVPEQ